MKQEKTTPDFVFIFGAVGSGNTFMCSCLTQDSKVYGINEDAFGATLERLLQSEEEFGTCPHSVEMFIDYLTKLRKDRTTLILKTPSNLRRLDLLRKYLPNAKYIFMIREPHAALASGLSRHEGGVEKVASLWKEDASKYLTSVAPDMSAISFESLTQTPKQAIDSIANRIMPLDDDVLQYAQRMNRPERSSADWWRRKVSNEVAAQIERVVQEQDMNSLYQSISGNEAATLSMPSVSPLESLKKNYFKIFYRLFR